MPGRQDGEQIHFTLCRWRRYRVVTAVAVHRQAIIEIRRELAASNTRAIWR